MLLNCECTVYRGGERINDRVMKNGTVFTGWLGGESWDQYYMFHNKSIGDDDVYCLNNSMDPESGDNYPANIETHEFTVACQPGDVFTMYITTSNTSSGFALNPIVYGDLHSNTHPLYGSWYEPGMVITYMWVR